MPTSNTADVDDRFKRSALLLGDEGLARLAESHVMVLGLGGVGSSCAEALARGGVGRLTIVDRDVVERTNVNRQALAFESTLGQAKAEVMRKMILDINPSCDVRAHTTFIDKDVLGEQLGALGRPDYIVDAIDTIAQKLVLARWCQDEGIPLISSMGGANKLDPCQLEFADLFDTHDCSMSRIMRKECRRRGIDRLEVLYSPEPPVIVEGQKESLPGQRPEKGTLLGTMSYFPPIMGQMMASLVIRRLAGLES